MDSLLPQLVVLFLAASLGASHPLKTCGFERIYNFGDSLSDAGNLIRESDTGATSPFASSPYGRTFFNYATGRCSDGLMLIDYFALAAGLPPPPSYKDMRANFNSGVNFAVAGATSLPTDILLSHGIMDPMTNSSLSVQLQWMLDHFNATTLDESDLVEKLSTALFLVGEIGGNDYNYGFFEGRTIPELEVIQPHVVANVISAAQSLIDVGAVKLIIPGDVPIGCLPIYRTLFKSNSTSNYDANQCIKPINDFIQNHNSLLRNSIIRLQRDNPGATIIYGDYYNAYLHLLKVAEERGYNTKQSCCGIGGEFNFEVARQCGHPDATVCDDPNLFMSWDGTHLTQRAYGIMAKWLLDEILPNLKCWPRQDDVDETTQGNNMGICLI